MATTASMSFEHKIDRWSTGAVERVDFLMKRVVGFALNSLVGLTPVDTGRARASYRVGVNRIDKSVDKRGKIKFTKKAGKNKGRVYKRHAAAKIAGDTVLAAQFVKVARLKAGDVAWVTNSLPYIIPLEEGHSPQSRWMFRTTFGRIKTRFPGFIQEAKMQVSTR